MFLKRKLNLKCILSSGGIKAIIGNLGHENGHVQVSFLIQPYLMVTSYH